MKMEYFIPACSGKRIDVKGTEEKRKKLPIRLPYAIPQ